MRNKNHIPYVLLMVFGEFFILLDAGFVGYIMAKENYVISSLDLILFWGFLTAGVILRYLAEKCKKDEEIAFLKRFFKKS